MDKIQKTIRIIAFLMIVETIIAVLTWIPQVAAATNIIRKTSEDTLYYNWLCTFTNIFFVALYVWLFILLRKIYNIKLWKAASILAFVSGGMSILVILAILANFMLTNSDLTHYHTLNSIIYAWSHLAFLLLIIAVIFIAIKFKSGSLSYIGGISYSIVSSMSLIYKSVRPLIETHFFKGYGIQFIETTTFIIIDTIIPLVLAIGGNICFTLFLFGLSKDSPRDLASNNA